MRPRRALGGPPGPGELRPHDPACRYLSIVAVKGRVALRLLPWIGIRDNGRVPY
jgi:hypothetical protein